MAKSEPDYTATTAWHDLTVDYPELSNATAFIQDKGPGQLLVNFSPSSSQPTDNSGVVLQYLDAITGTAAHLWVKAVQGTANVAFGLTD